jgi:hypothetical protein
MSGVFSKPKMPPPPAPIEAPQQMTVDAEQVDRERGDMMRRRRGRAATILTASANNQTGAGMGSVAAKSLLGQ